MRKVDIILGVIVALAVAGFFIFYFTPSNIKSSQNNSEIQITGMNIFQTNPETFDVDTVFLKFLIKSNGSYEGQIKVTNTREKSQDFSLSLFNLQDFISLNETNFKMNGGEQKNVGIHVSNINARDYGIYTGMLEISQDHTKKNIPIILEIESEDVLFDSNIQMATDNILANKKLTPEIKIFDLGRIGTSSITAEYFVKDFNGNTIISESENIVVKDQVVVSKAFNLPENLANGDYTLGVVLKYKNSIGTASVFFSNKSEKNNFFGFLDSNFYIALIFILVIFLLLLFLFFSLYSRDKLLRELKDQYKQAIENQEKYLGEKEKANEKALKTPEEKELNKKLFAKVREKRKEEIKKIHETRLKKLKELKKTNAKDKMNKQISEWKKQGYNTNILEKTFKAPEAKDIQKQISEWKKQGYNTKVLEGK